MARLLLLLVALLPLSCGERDASPAVTPDLGRPNILFILTDDQGIGDLSLHGNDSIRTPNMDALLSSGAKFNRFYVSPVCAPTRASFLSGLYAPRTGAVFVTRRRETMDDAVITIPEHLKKAGYRTGLFGKWHNGATKPYDPAGQGFDEFLGFTLGHFNDYFNGELENENNEAVPFSGDLTQILTDTAAAFMLEDTDQPFFTMLTYQAPHTPVQVADKYWDAVKTRGLTDYNTGIYAMIESIDDRIGQLLERLEAAGKLDNTIIVFSTDNGPNGDRYRMGFKGVKGQVDEGGVRVPFVIKFPGEHLANGVQYDVAAAAHIDLLPTLLEAVGLPVPAGLDGRSLIPLLTLDATQGFSPGDQTDSILRSSFFRDIYAFKQGYDFKPYPGSMRSGENLYVLRSPGEHELYNLRRDTGQTNNLYTAETPKAINDENYTEQDLTGNTGQQMARRYAAFAATVARPDLVAPPINLDAAAGPVHLLAHEGEPLGKTHFNDEYGWANDWFVDLDAEGAVWPVVTTKERTYVAVIKYHNDEATSRTIRLLSDSGADYSAELPRFATEQIPVADRTKRKEVYPRSWGEFRTEQVVIPAGTTELRVATDGKPGVWVKEITLLEVSR
ncbi:sulfatase-like hydrolase/transferase [Neolewinella antarctica]|uniref:Arylsulfatase A n=1 Tax=Neolewinella antarctica TaxID=442734 RepID=A0ABX0XFY9_9BACT|nr:sulfatase-like hydrolase/transferase [Neolewinella antarctica]NJC28239.1 arylsulfatase A [Neolewinella antarctica]